MHTTQGAAAIVALAESIAADGHDGQRDRAGDPILGHLRRVVDRLDDPLDQSAAWLHAVVDHTRWTTTNLLIAGARLPAPARSGWSAVVSDVDRLTRQSLTSRAGYDDAVRTSPRAVRVKLASLDETGDPARSAPLDRRTRRRLERLCAVARAAVVDRASA